MIRYAWLIVAALILVAFGLGIGRQCPGKPSKAERRADSVLADTTRFLEERERRDSIILAGKAETQKVKDENRRLKTAVKTLIDSVDHERTEAAALTPLPSGITAHDSIVRLDTALQAQIKVAARLRDDVVPALQRIIRNDSTALWKQDATIAEQTLALRDEYRRNDQLTTALRDLRKDRKPGKFLGFLPGWTDEALLVAGAAYVGYKAGRS